VEEIKVFTQTGERGGDLYYLLIKTGGTKEERNSSGGLSFGFADQLLDEIGTYEQHLLYESLDNPGALIQTYNNHYRMPEPNGAGTAAAQQPDGEPSG
jgi:hypothetical protein